MMKIGFIIPHRRLGYYWLSKFKTPTKMLSLLLMKNVIIIQYSTIFEAIIQRIVDVIRPTNIYSFFNQAYILYQIFTFYSPCRKFRPYSTAVNLPSISNLRYTNHKQIAVSHHGSKNCLKELYS